MLLTYDLPSICLSVSDMDGNSDPYVLCKWWCNGEFDLESNNITGYTPDNWHVTYKYHPIDEEYHLNQTSIFGFHVSLVGGFNPFMKHVSQIGSSPQVRVNINNVWNHQPVSSRGSFKKSKEFSLKNPTSPEIACCNGIQNENSCLTTRTWWFRGLPGHHLKATLKNRRNPKPSPRVKRYLPIFRLDFPI